MVAGLYDVLEASGLDTLIVLLRLTLNGILCKSYCREGSSIKGMNTRPTPLAPSLLPSSPQLALSSLCGGGCRMYLFLSEFPLGLVLFAPLQTREGGRERGEREGREEEREWREEEGDGSSKVSEHLSCCSAALLGRPGACNFCFRGRTCRTDVE